MLCAKCLKSIPYLFTLPAGVSQGAGSIRRVGKVIAHILILGKDNVDR